MPYCCCSSLVRYSRWGDSWKPVGRYRDAKQVKRSEDNKVAAAVDVTSFNYCQNIYVGLTIFPVQSKKPRLSKRVKVTKKTPVCIVWMYSASSPWVYLPPLTLPVTGEIPRPLNRSKCIGCTTISPIRFAILLIRLMYVRVFSQHNFSPTNQESQARGGVSGSSSIHNCAFVVFGATLHDRSPGCGKPLYLYVSLCSLPRWALSYHLGVNSDHLVADISHGNVEIPFEHNYISVPFGKRIYILTYFSCEFFFVPLRANLLCFEDNNNNGRPPAVKRQLLLYTAVIMAQIHIFILKAIESMRSKKNATSLPSIPLRRPSLTAFPTALR